MVSFDRSGGLGKSPERDQDRGSKYESGKTYLKVLGNMNNQRTYGDMQGRTWWGLKSGSKIMTVSALHKLIPTPPARVERIYIKTSDP
jgi:hypothetical protein